MITISSSNSISGKMSIHLILRGLVISCRFYGGLLGCLILQWAEGGSQVFSIFG